MTNHRGFTLLIAILLATVAVTIGVMLLDISYKQVVLASTAKQSQFGFYAADAAMECALYYDQQLNAFSYTSPLASSNIECEDLAVTNYTTAISGIGQSARRTTTFTVPCATSGTRATITVYKYSSATTSIYANGYSTCNTSDPRRVERGLKVSY